MARTIPLYYSYFNYFFHFPHPIIFPLFSTNCLHILQIFNFPCFHFPSNINYFLYFVVQHFLLIKFLIFHIFSNFQYLSTFFIQFILKSRKTTCLKIIELYVCETKVGHFLFFSHPLNVLGIVNRVCALG